jgi:hypothetical protein
MPDVVGWHYDSKGCFSVRSAYKVHRAAENRKKSGAGLGRAEIAEVLMIFGRNYGR